MSLKSFTIQVPKSSHPHLENNFLPLDKMSSGSNDLAPLYPAFYNETDGQTDRLIWPEQLFKKYSFLSKFFLKSVALLSFNSSRNFHKFKSSKKCRNRIRESERVTLSVFLKVRAGKTY
jgi:hypothetical protein